MHYYRLEEIYKEQIKNALAICELSDYARNSYQTMFITFIKYYRYKHPVKISNEEIKAFLLLCGQRSDAYHNMMVNSIKMLYKMIYDREISDKYLIRPKAAFRLPDVLDPDEVVAIYNQLDNKKHKLLISLI